MSLGQGRVERVVHREDRLRASDLEDAGNHRLHPGQMNSAPSASAFRRAPSNTLRPVESMNSRGEQSTTRRAYPSSTQPSSDSRNRSAVW